MLQQLINAGLASNRADALKLVLGALALGVAATEIIKFYSNKVNATNPSGDKIFPTDLLRSNDLSQDLFFIKFQFKQYEKRSQDNSKVIRVNGPGIKLPIPKSLRDNLSVSYDSPSLGSLVGATLDVLSGDAILRNQPPRVPTLLPQLPSIPQGASNLAAAAALQAIDLNSPLAQATSAFTGIAPNPYQTWLFKHPNFRNHSFSWTLAPESPEESDIIRTIVRLFQKNMLPAKQNGSNALLLQYPSLVYIQLFAGNPQNSSYLYDFKPCVLKSVSADYAAAGRPAFFTSNNQRGVSGAPAAVTLSIELQEIEFWTQDDFKDDFNINNIIT